MKLRNNSLVRSAAILLPGLIIVARARADEATLPDGRRLQGSMTLSREGHLQFISGNQSLRLEQLHRVRFSEHPAMPFRLWVAHRVALSGEQQLTGELLGVDAQHVLIRTAWSGRLRIPRRAVVAILHPPGYIAVFDDDFENGLKAWKLTGSPGVSDRRQTSGKHSLRLDAAGQSAEYLLPTTLSAGKVGINFHDPGDTAGARWQVEAKFEGEGDTSVLRVTIAGDGKDYTVQLPGDGTGARVPRSGGWHRLEIDFDHRSLIVSVDDLLLWPPPSAAGGDAKENPIAPGKALRAVRLLCTESPSEKTTRGEVLFDNFSIARAVSDAPRRIAEPSQDELWLLAGDQLFGSVLRSDRRTIELRGKPGPRSFRWSEVRGIFFRRAAEPDPKTDGQHVRVRLRSGIGAGLDQLNGIVRKLDDRRLVLDHPLLGEIEIDRRRLHELRTIAGSP